MGGCYNGSYKYAKSEAVEKPKVSNDFKKNLRSYFKDHQMSQFISAYKGYFESKPSGFILEVAKNAGITDAKDIPKEFPEIEYEVKFDVRLKGKGDEPSIVEYMDAFEFPCGRNTRFFKDPMNTFAEGVNNFYGNNLDERLVVIEKGNGLFLKEKGLVTPVQSDMPYSEIVIKRSELRYPASFEEVERKVTEVCKESGVKYRGKIRKEKGDFFVLDSNDGRIYSFSFTRAHLIKPGKKEESGIQRQLEIEYAGYIPGVGKINVGSEEEIVSGMIDNARYTYGLYSSSPVKDGWRMNLLVTNERKYDFIVGKDKMNLENRITLPAIISTTGRKNPRLN
ncbi:MAG: hypothetical protein WC867_00615 [Candidatus Pacearchaeota archaeon]|jgi:hypothetical protein